MKKKIERKNIKIIKGEDGKYIADLTDILDDIEIFYSEEEKEDKKER